MTIKEPKIGIGVIVVKDEKVLLGRRKGTHGGGTWSFAGGHLEFNEELEAGAQREVREETGLNIKNIRLGTFTNDIFRNEEKHYITLFVVADYDFGELEVKEPERCEEWQWFEWNKLPTPLFLPIQNLLKQNFNPFNI